MSIYYALSLLTVGRAAKIVRRVKSRSGLEAWRRLVRRYARGNLAHPAPQDCGQALQPG